MFNKDRLLQNYLDMIKINSVTGSEQTLASYISKKLEDMGIRVEWSYYNDEKSPCIYGRLKGQGEGPTLLLIGHMDTVEVTRGWNTNPFEPVVEGDKVYGLGACDMKGGLSAILETVNTIIDQNIILKGDILVAFVSDEEVLSRGTYKLLQEGLTADMAIMAECRFKEAAIGFRGRYGINVTVYGKSAHASKYPFVGENAVINASKLAIAIESLSTVIDPVLGEGTWCVRHIEGGIKNTLSVPDKCELFVDRYVVPGENFETCKAQIIEAAREIGLEGKVEVELMPRQSPFMEAFVVDRNNPLVVTLQDKYQEITGGELPLAYDKSVCDSNYLVTLGDIPTVTFGPSGENMHGANECGYISQIEASTQIYIKTAIEILGE
jgi:succinyl-diaminopimelate desuccinylase